MSHPRLLRLLVGAALILAGGLPALDGRALAVQQPLLVSVRVEEVPEAPDDTAWQQATPVDVPLAVQAVTLPRLDEISVPTVTVRSLNDGQRLAFLLEWADETRDVRAVRPDEFRDAAAILFPVAQGLPSVCMGSAGQLVNLWHWKADWQEDLAAGYQELPQAYPNFYQDVYPFAAGQPPYEFPGDFSSAEAQQYLLGLAAGNPLSQVERPSPVEELLAEGFGTAAHRQSQTVAGAGQWADGRWRVVFVRSMAADEVVAADLTRPQLSLAFAVWNGARQEVGARKQLSTYIGVEVEGQAAPPAAWPLVIIWESAALRGALVAGVLLGLIVGLLMLRKGVFRRPGGSP